MKTQNSIPTTKVERASRFVSTGIKIGGNYIKHYSQKLVNNDVSRDELHADNAEDIYNTLSELKGSALKVAQMLSMDKNLLPKAYQDKFSMSQYNAPPLSAPLVVNTFVKTLGTSPQNLYDSFELNASNAASIGQVHIAFKDGKKLAVKIQYPGVANTISSDLKLVKPFALRIAGLSSRDADKYFDEVEEKLLEETDYNLELRRSIELSELCSFIPKLKFPKYYPELSSKKIITMDWLTGKHLKEFLETNPTQEIRNQIGQTLWDFYDYQVHTLQKVHADPHPGNFLFEDDGTVGVFDFGCVKVIPQDFYAHYLPVHNGSIYDDLDKAFVAYEGMELIHESDSPEERSFFFTIFKQMIEMLSQPSRVEEFDFGNEDFFKQIYSYFERVANLPEVKNSKVARGSRHSLYVNRTYFGLYSILSDLKAKVKTRKIVS